MPERGGRGGLGGKASPQDRGDPGGSPPREYTAEFEELRELRARRPELIAARAAERRRRALLGADGRLMIVAADHPARGSLGVRGVGNAMADRYDLLRRLLVALSRPGVDGLLATADIVEDLLLLGGDPAGPPEETYARWKAALELPGVRGFVIGRALLYPHDGDVAAAVDAACALVHDVTVRP